MRFSVRSNVRFAFRSAAVPTIVLPAPVLLLAVLLLAVPTARAASSDTVLDSTGIAQLESRAALANPREQCFLYAELVHSMTEMAGKQMLEGDIEHASQTLKRVEQYAHLIHMGLARDTKRLKNTEMLMHKTTYRLSGYLHAASSEDKATLEATLKQLDNVQTELLDQVFNH